MEQGPPGRVGFAVGTPVWMPFGWEHVGADGFFGWIWELERELQGGFNHIHEANGRGA